MQMKFRRAELLRAFMIQELVECLAHEKLKRSPERCPDMGGALAKTYDDTVANRDLVVQMLEPHEVRLFDAWRSQAPGSAERAAFQAIIDDPTYPVPLTGH